MTFSRRARERVPGRTHAAAAGHECARGPVPRGPARRGGRPPRDAAVGCSRQTRALSARSVPRAVRVARAAPGPARTHARCVSLSRRLVSLPRRSSSGRSSGRGAFPVPWGRRHPPFAAARPRRPPPLRREGVLWAAGRGTSGPPGVTAPLRQQLSPNPGAEEARTRRRALPPPGALPPRGGSPARGLPSARGAPVSQGVRAAPPTARPLLHPRLPFSRGVRGRGGLSSVRPGERRAVGSGGGGSSSHAPLPFPPGGMGRSERTGSAAMSATHPTRLETRTKESNACASRGLARKPPWRNEGEGRRGRSRAGRAAARSGGVGWRSAPPPPCRTVPPSPAPVSPPRRPRWDPEASPVRRGRTTGPSRPPRRGGGA
ncbi:translation initiation factor IF-2-like [Perognathus longimembris pacificus]|uniref:translation initiation factor IF-2-like n=1 Tax=Perognathus longimembris pacificus TaxID=214514 RepID=UPI0020188F78|nr:translation initiation factor IF-2-like [Perognathus longimembris pacificus]